PPSPALLADPPSFPTRRSSDRVAENGALLYRPQTREETMLAEPPPPQLAERLRERGATPIGVGRVIVATREPHEVAAVEAVRELDRKSTRLNSSHVASSYAVFC